MQSNFEEYAQSTIVFCTVWAVGGILEEQARLKFQDFILNLIKGQNICKIYDLGLDLEPLKLKVIFNDSMVENMYNVCYRMNEKSWLNWMQTEVILTIPQKQRLGVKFLLRNSSCRRSTPSATTSS